MVINVIRDRFCHYTQLAFNVSIESDLSGDAAGTAIIRTTLPE